MSDNQSENWDAWGPKAISDTKTVPAADGQELPEPVAFGQLGASNLPLEALYTADQMHAAIEAEREALRFTREEMAGIAADADAQVAGLEAELSTLRARHDEAVRMLQQIRADAAAQDVLFEWWGQIDAALATKGEPEPLQDHPAVPRG